MLLVDDEEDMRLIGKMGLEMGGFTVTAVGSVDEALVSARREPPDVVLADWLMPGREGTELLDELRKMEDLRGVPVIFLTGRSSAEDGERLIRMGAAGTIAKPFDPSELADRVKRILDAKPA